MYKLYWNTDTAAMAPQMVLEEAGLAYETVPVDLTYNLGLRVETYVGGFVVAFSNLLGLLPARGSGRK